MIIGKHKKILAWEVSPLQDGVLGYLPKSRMWINNPDFDWLFGTIIWRSTHCHKHCIPSDVIIETISLNNLVQEASYLVYQLDTIIFHNEDGNNINLQLPSHYRKWADVFSQEGLEVLPIDGEFKKKLNLQPVNIMWFGQLDPCSGFELMAINEWIDRELHVGRTRRSNSPTVLPILLIPKPDQFLHLCLDFKELNKMIIKNRYPLPIMDELQIVSGKANSLWSSTWSTASTFFDFRKLIKRIPHFGPAMDYTNIPSCHLGYPTCSQPFRQWLMRSFTTLYMSTL